MKVSHLFCAALSVLSFGISPAFSEEAGKCPAIQDLSQTPPHQIGMYLDGYHTYRNEANLTGDQQRQIRSAHFCKQVSPDLYQCVIYSGNNKDARVIGIEYVITPKLYQTLSDTEKKLWHAHDGEVDTGLLILPGMEKDKQKEVLTALRGTYGKTWHTWTNLEGAVPLGEPALMWNVDPKKISTETKKSVAARAVDPTF
jgi:hypothetical protein